ncbi:fungal specific transcription factor domain-containing protein [Verticillium alfalfae VaMs.102]|uniref:Fungal specific transcription factor domain-containing protein n=1 Tax=Verticillium alfalfae (strain VaMs.102 / ATCC MYA-4576 / FGSC 10136) TaxID=526221 RepID=C9SHI9_VERA1|nr:fungal specific transcription factor domain-containing protein [Verticillium alfalfae VaMs.102]EEY18412.1 fungal specific transcription factor domain-containing protein [Verticillium alfalfae VaMs.102]
MDDIRCDKGSPCSHCRRVGVECVQLTVKPREKRTRILLTSQYERKIDVLDHRLDGVTKLLEDLKIILSASSSSPGLKNTKTATSPMVPPATSPASRAGPSESAAGQVTEGESSLSAHSAFVHDFLQGLVEEGSLHHPDPEIDRTMKALSGLVSASRRQPETHESMLSLAKPKESAQQRISELPPIQTSVALIRLAKTQKLAGTGWIYEFITMRPFGDLCLNVYFSEDHSAFDSISVNAGLYSLCWDYALSSDIAPGEKEQYMTYAQSCRENLETGLANLPLYFPATSDAIAALLFGAFYTLQFAKSSLCWALSSKASELCQTLGYHRAASTENQVAEDPAYAQFLFWTTYYIEKGLSLRLGRPSTIPDWDITVSPPSSSAPDQAPVLAFFVLWVQTAKCQGNIYELLYSPGAVGLPDALRQSRVEILLSSLRDIDKETQKTRIAWLEISKENSGDDLMDFYATSDDILRLSLLTHVHRAAPRASSSSTTFSSDCLEAARMTLKRHHDCMEIIHRTGGKYFQTYIHWTLLFAPFIPFIVLFCHVMETRSEDEFARLEAFVTSIGPASVLSEPAAKMLHLFQVLHNIARRYIELGGSVAQNRGQYSSIPQMNASLAALGVPHVGVVRTNSQQLGQRADQSLAFDSGSLPLDRDTEFGTGEAQIDQNLVNPVLWMGNGPQLEDWFYNNQASIQSLQEPGDSKFR